MDNTTGVQSLMNNHWGAQRNLFSKIFEAIWFRKWNRKYKVPSNNTEAIILCFFSILGCNMCFIDFSFYCFSDIKCSKFAYWIPLHDFSRMGLYVFAVVFVCMCTWSPAPMSSSIRFVWTPSAILTDCCSIATKRFSVRQSKPTFFELWIFGCHLVAVVDQLGQSQYTNMQKRSIVQQTTEHGTRLLAVF